MRNRGYIWHYLRVHGDLNPFTFAIGTFLVWLKEAIRILAVDKSGKDSFAELWRGIKAAREIKQDQNWTLPPTLIDSKTVSDSDSQAATPLIMKSLKGNA
jgi:hypothetical protein